MQVLGSACMRVQILSHTHFLVALTTPTHNRKWRVLSRLLGYRSGNGPEFAEKHL